MSDVDPKELLLKNKGLVVLYALAIVPIVLWFVLVNGGAKQEFKLNARKLRQSERNIKNLIKKINSEDPAEKPYTQQHIDAFKSRRESYEKQVRELKQVIVDRDQELEKWFDAPLTRDLKPGEEPNPNDYITLFRTQLEALVKEYEPIVTPEGGGAPRIYSQEPPRNQLRLWQKRFWAQKYLLQAIKEGSKESVEAGKPGGRIEEPVRFSDTGRRGDDGGDEVVDRIGVAVTVTCRFPDLPRIIERILAQPITYQVLRVDVSKSPFMIEKSEYDLRVDGRDTTFNDPYYTGELETHDDFKGEGSLDEYIAEPPVQVSLELEVLDFKVEPPAEPAPAEGEAPSDEAGEDGEGGGS